MEFDETHPFFNQKPYALPESDKFFERSPSQECGYLRKVEYSNERPQHDSILDLTSTSVLLVKSKEWEYEQEWRMLQLLENSNETIRTELGDIYLFSIPPSCIRGVIIGSRMSGHDRAEIRRIFKRDERYSHVQVYSSVLDEKRFILNLIRDEI